MSTTNTKKSLTEKDLETIYKSISEKKQIEVKPEPRKERNIRSANDGTHIENVPRVMSDLYIVDTGTYQNNVQQISAMRDAGLALSIVRQQMLYGQDLEAASPMTRIRYAEKMEILNESKRLSAEARLRQHRADEIRIAKEKEAELAAAAAAAAAKVDTNTNVQQGGDTPPAN